MMLSSQLLKWKAGVPKLWQSIFERFEFDSSDELSVAQVGAFKQRVPVLYTMLIINTFLLSFTHYEDASPVLTILIPSILILIMVCRGIYWYRLDIATVNRDRARILIRDTTILSGVFAAVLLFWALAMYEHGINFDPQGQITTHGQVVLYVGLTFICCISLLMHARAAALLISVLMIPPFCLFLIWNGSLIEVVVSINLALIALVMLFVMMVFAHDFRQLVNSRGELRRMHEHQAQLAATDALTGLNNRRHFYNALEHIVQERRPFAVAMVDLDRFKQINDAHGHSIGDEVLRQIALRMTSVSQGAISVARVGGDEFAMLFTGLETEALCRVGDRIVDICKRPLTVHNLTVSVGASVGLNEVVLAELHEAPNIHVERADYALFHAKQAGRGCVELFTPEHEQAIRRSGLVEQALKAADLDAELFMLFQPIALAKSLKLNGFEALVRWNSPVLGLVSPGEFIPIAERCGMIHEVTRVVLKKSLGQIHLWPVPVRLKVNLSMHDLRSPEQMHALLAILEQEQVDGARLTFEITETAFSENIETMLDGLTLLRTTGASIAIDDFGTGYSSLSSIHHIRPDLIKIDRSFVEMLFHDDCGYALIKTIIEMCQNLGARSLAEGIELEGQIHVLTQLGCDELQGYWFSKPVTAEQALQIALSGTVTLTSSS
ncbi:putative bifunctional diguanylate cyclase/phosphodiesterase [Castellaniella sp.]|uniref:putative bifunctional diguanylate cyclase/phosphodiesterase n=1 Tax=Castellaniella sp. TaxID=1955812 RepID=UPI003A88A72B